MTRSSQNVFLVRRCPEYDGCEPIRVFGTRDEAEAWRDEYVTQFEVDDTRERTKYHIGQGAYASFTVKEVPYGPEE